MCINNYRVFKCEIFFENGVIDILLKYRKEYCIKLYYFFISVNCVCSSGSAGSRGALGALMTCLRAARSQGVLKSVEEELWGGLVPLPLMRQALVHKHDQVNGNHFIFHTKPQLMSDMPNCIISITQS